MALLRNAIQWGAQGEGLDGPGSMDHIVFGGFSGRQGERPDSNRRPLGPQPELSRSPTAPGLVAIAVVAASRSASTRRLRWGTIPADRGRAPVRDIREFQDFRVPEPPALRPR